MRQISNPNPDLSSQFESDWQRAQDSYQNGLKAGYDDATADALYLQPVRSKWKIIQSSPQLLEDKSQLQKFHNEFDSAVDNFHKNFNTYGRDSGQWAASQSGSLLPTLQKWSIEASLPTERKNEYADNADELGALKEVQSGYDPMMVLSGHNSSRWSPEFLNKFQSEALRAGNIADRKVERADAAATKAAAATAKANSPEGLAKQRFILQSQLNQAKEAGADGMVEHYSKQLAALDAAATNAPSIGGDGSYTFTPPVQDVSEQVQNDHPDWSPAQVALSASGKLKGAGEATKGYKIGATYKGGLTYLGGDPNDESSWKKSESPSN